MQADVLSNFVTRGPLYLLIEAETKWPPFYSAKPLSQPMLEYCWLDLWEQTSVKSYSKLIHLHSRKCIWKCRLPKWLPFCSGVSETQIKINSLWLSDGIWRQRSGSTLALVKVIAWTNVDWSSAKSSDIRAISQEMPQPPITKIRLNITYLKFHSDFTGANELTHE